MGMHKCAATTSKLYVYIPITLVMCDYECPVDPCII